jgi:uncharacterized protein YkwD
MLALGNSSLVETVPAFAYQAFPNSDHHIVAIRTYSAQARAGLKDFVTIMVDEFEGNGGSRMGRMIRIVLLCAALSGCASTGGLPSLSAIGSSGEPEKPAKSSEPASASSTDSSGLSGIWSNFSSAFSSGTQPASQKSDVKPEGDPNEALRLINEYRSKKGLNPLLLDPKATAAAAMLAKDMAKHDHMSHVGPNGADVGKRLTAAGYSYRLAAENVGVGQTSLPEMIDGWKKSPPHSRNMLLADAKDIGIAYEYKADTKYKTFWALVIAAP